MTYIFVTRHQLCVGKKTQVANGMLSEPSFLKCVIGVTKNLAHMRDSGCLSCFFSIILRGKSARGQPTLTTLRMPDVWPLC